MHPGDTFIMFYNDVLYVCVQLLFHERAMFVEIYVDGGTMDLVRLYTDAGWDMGYTIRATNALP